MTTEQRAQIEAARLSIAALRDTAREYGQMPSKVRDMHVSLLHRQLDALAQALTTLAWMKSPAESCLEERAAGNGGCGACAVCCKELRDALEKAHLQTQRMRREQGDTILPVCLALITAGIFFGMLLAHSFMQIFW